MATIDLDAEVALHPHCPFCIELAEPAYCKSVFDGYWPYPDRIIATAGTATAIAALAPQVYPYALILTKRHIRSLAQNTAEERTDVIACLNQILPLFGSSTLSLFEHGDCGRHYRSACIAHCHLHIIDGRFPIEKWMRVEYPEAQSVSFDPKAAWGNAAPYLFAGRYCTASGITGSMAPADDSSSQYFRRLIARNLGLDWWNWRERRNGAWMLRLVRDARRLSSECLLSESSCYDPVRSSASRG